MYMCVNFAELLRLFDKMDVDNDDKLRFNETGFEKPTFDNIDTDGNSVLTVDEIKKLKAKFEEKLNALETSTNTDSLHAVTLSSGVPTITVMVTTPQPLISSPVAISSSTTVISSSSADISSSPVAVKSSVLNVSPSNTSNNLDDIDDLGKDLDAQLNLNDLN